MWFFEDGQHGWLMAVGVVHLLIFWIIAILAAVALWTWLTGNSHSQITSSQDKTPLIILQERYAKGEIEQDEFEQKKRDLEA